MTSQSVVDTTKVDLIAIASDRADWLYAVVRYCCEYGLIDSYIFFLAEARAQTAPEFLWNVASPLDENALPISAELAKQFRQLAKRKDSDEKGDWHYRLVNAYSNNVNKQDT